MFSEYRRDGNVIAQNSETLISVSEVSDRIQIYPYYFQQNIEGAVNDCFLREGVVAKLQMVVEQLPKEYHLVILDGWRSFETQNALYEMTKSQFESQFENRTDLIQQLSRFVATPSKDPLNPAPHYTGGAVDLTIADKNGWLNMGTDFDEFTEKSHSLYFESKGNLTENEVVFRENRRLLRHLMESVGFLMNPEEWWHFDYGNARWAKGTNETPIYYGIELSVKGEE